jgi:hypothetical protein
MNIKDLTLKRHQALTLLAARYGVTRLALLSNRAAQLRNHDV